MNVKLGYSVTFVSTSTFMINTQTRHKYYSKTSNSEPSKKQTTSVQRTAHLAPTDFTIELIHFEPPRSRHLSTPNNGH